MSNLYFSTCLSSNSTPEKINNVPINPPAIAPRGLNACAMFKRCSEVSIGPAALAMNGLADVSRKARPVAITNNEIKNGRYSPMKIETNPCQRKPNREEYQLYNPNGEERRQLVEPI